MKEYPHNKWSGHAKILLDLIQENERLRENFCRGRPGKRKIEEYDLEQSKRLVAE